VDLFCEHLGEDRSRVGPESSLAEFGFDSLDLIEFVMGMEEAFDLQISDRVVGQAFAAKLTFRQWAEVIVEHWQTWPEPPPRTRWRRSRPARVESVPFFQAAGPLDSDSGPLYEPRPANREGHLQFRRHTDGMRCVHVGPFVVDAEPVACAAYAHFLNAVGPVPDGVARDWFGVDAADHRRRYVPVRRGWSGRWRPARGAARLPMMLVSWYGANAYALWANRRDWRQYRGDGSVPSDLRDRRPPGDDPASGLPTEAQWEHAARGRPGAAPATGGPPLAGCHRPGAVYAPADLPLAPVNERRGMSPFGLHHVVGNVWQWCRDWYHPAGPVAGPTGVRTERGGSWVGPARLADLSYRRGRHPALRGRCLGFRCVGDAAALP
jgi:acyl carrier protein